MDRPLALYRRYLWESKNISWIYTADVDKLLKSKHQYQEQYNIDVPDLSDRQRQELDDLMIGATLASESQVERDMWGWTVRLPLKPWGLFCGVEPEGMVCTRFTHLSETAAKDPVGSFAVQRVTASAPIRQTSLIPRDTSARYLVEQYFDESEQLPARIAIIGSEAVMALSMPDADWSIVETLKESDLMSLFHELLKETEPSPAPQTPANTSSEKLKQQFAAAKGAIGTTQGDLKIMHEAVYYYDCRCDASNIRQMLDNLPESQRIALWGDLPELEIECPRCGRKHLIKRHPSSD
jgi:hypothetical protein